MEVQTIVRRIAGLMLMILTGLSGCSQYIDPNVPEPILPLVEPGTGREYLLYRPSAYDAKLRWPLLVVCHGGFPDSPVRRVRDWTQLAEEKGFLVVAPSLSSASGWMRPGAERQAQRLQQDESFILAVIRHVEAGHRISEERVLIHGWSGGAEAALYTGLRQPAVFRTVSVSNPRFDGGNLGDTALVTDVHQPVLVQRAVGDHFTGRQGEDCRDWLLGAGLNPEDGTVGLDGRTEARDVIAFIERSLRTRPWIQIRAFVPPGTSGETIQFKLRCSFVPKTYHWTFGDGASSVLAEPVHVYPTEGTYVVTATVRLAAEDEYTRAVELRIPGGRPVPLRTPAQETTKPSRP
jgi:dienelactone hydrolase